MLFSLGSNLVLKSSVLTPLSATLASALVGGGVISGVVKMETSETKPLSTVFSKVGQGLAGMVGSSDGQSENIDIIGPVVTFFSSLQTQLSSLYGTVSQPISSTSQFITSSGLTFDSIKTFFTDIGGGLKGIEVEGDSVKEILNTLGEKKSALSKVVEKMIANAELISNMFRTIYKNKSEWSNTLSGVAQKVGGYKELAKALLNESETIVSQLDKLKAQWSTISTKLESVVKKINEKKSELEEITQGMQWNNLSQGGGMWNAIKKNGADYLVKVSQQADQIDSGITTLKQQKNKLQKLMSDSGKSVATGLERKDDFATMLGSGDSNSFDISSVVNKLEKVNEDTLSKLGEIQTKLLSNVTGSKLLVKTAGKGLEGFVKMINNGDKYEHLLTNNGSSQSEK